MPSGYAPHLLANTCIYLASEQDTISGVQIRDLQYIYIWTYVKHNSTGT